MSNSLQIVAFCCEHCAYAAADLAGGLRIQYPEAIKIIQLPCTGKLDVLMILEALEHGLDGVMVAGWLPGDCHYLEGNDKAKRRVEYLKNLLVEIGLEPERVRMFNMSSAMASQFAAAATEMYEQIDALGKSPLKGWTYWTIQRGRNYTERKTGLIDWGKLLSDPRNYENHLQEMDNPSKFFVFID